MASDQRKGGMQAFLTSHDDASVEAGQDAASHATPAQIGSDLSITLDFRDRSSTLGSLGDLGMFGLVGPPTPTEPAVHIVGGDGSSTSQAGEDPAQRSALGAILESHQGGYDHGGQQPSHLGSPRPVSASTPGSLGSGATPNPLAPQPQHASLGPSATTAQPLGKPLPFPGMRHINHAAPPSTTSAPADSPATNAALAKFPTPPATGGGGAATGTGSQPSSGGSASAFLSGNFDVADGNSTQQLQGITMVAHTPPSAMGPASYETRHFGKRARAGSISGRLRSASDAGQALEDKGLIDRTQKGVLKDLIIAGDDALQEALDRYEEGNSSALETMIKSGKLQSNSSADIDVLGDLDLDFLTVDDDFGRLGVATNVGSDAPHPGALHSTKSLPISIASGPPHQQQVPLQSSVAHNEYGSGDNTTQPSNTSYADDGIGELEFNGEYSNAATEEELHLPSGAYGPQSSGGTIPIRPTAAGHAQDPSSTSTVEGRFRANSLAFGALLNEPSPQQSYGNWMDRHPAGNNSVQASGRTSHGMPSSNVVGANGSLYIIPSGAQRPQPAPDNRQKKTAGRGGVAAVRTISTAEHTKNDIKMTASAINRLEQAAERRREKQQKREQKEREKKERKERRERETKVKKEREAKEKQERKVKREAAAKAKQEKKKEKRNSLSPRIGKEAAKDDSIDGEPKEIVSGTGRPRSLSDPSLSVGLDNDGLLQIDHPEGWVGAYSPDSRKMRIERFLEKRNHRVWTKKVKYDVRKNFADSRLRVKGRFVKKEDELLMRDLMSLT
eukprot:CAMPEP_0113535330 /NCGR_PEP_ID=MMETSP0015_2-20120614/5645_1 /TAXON_ID=2838 /ORGANISM="Odontella" /LENGTH=785 /DNA_ID=CAMNT_0000434571 /DNA_START=348 /DNA_END=2705 /DNA_ORIENTATION=+ /assembly_acc=CAM_ASM_000160